jgi:hypothetical protein
MRKTPVVLGVLSMVFGGLAAVGAAYTLFAQAFFTKFMGPLATFGHAVPAMPGQPNPGVMFERLTQIMKEMAPWMAGLAGAKGLLSVVLMIIGWGLIKRAPNARRAALLWVAAAFAYIVAESLFQVLVYLPRFKEIIEPLSTMPFQQQMNQMAEKSGWILAAVFNAIYPLVLLALLGRPSAARDFDDAATVSRLT